MHIKQSPADYRQTSIRTYPFENGVNSSVAATRILYGEQTKLTRMDCKYAKISIALEAFQKDYATIDRQYRQKLQAKRAASEQRRKEANIMRQSSIKQKQSAFLSRLAARQTKSQISYKVGDKMTIHKNSMPVDPLTQKYHQSPKGQQLAQKDAQTHLNRLVRAHYLQTMGSSGYNIVTGRNSVDMGRLVPEHAQEAYNRKINDLYSKFRLNP